MTVPILTAPIKTSTRYNVNSPTNEQSPQLSVIGTVPIAQAARFDFIGQDQNTGSVFGDQYILVDGGVVIIDGMQLKNVVFRNVHILYRGGPVQMDNTYFVNCVFEVQREPNGESFASTFLQSGPSTTFAAS